MDAGEYHEGKEERDSLIDLSERAVAASEAKSSFLSNMSHEIRTPINAILGMNEMILRESDDDTIRDYSNTIKSAGNSLLGLINDILDFSKIESGKMELVPAEYDTSARTPAARPTAENTVTILYSLHLQSSK